MLVREPSSQGFLNGFIKEIVMRQLKLKMPFRDRGGLHHARRWMALALVSVSAFMAPIVHAADDGPSKGPVKVVLTQARVEMEGGKEKLGDASTVKPGDVIEYRAVYTNTSNSAVRDLEANLPVPEGLEYVPRSAKSDTKVAVRVISRDGQAGVEPLMTVKDGKSVEVPYAEYGLLRWHVGSLQAGRSVSVSARARVASAPVLPPPSVSRVSSTGATSETTPQR